MDLTVLESLHEGRLTCVVRCRRQDTGDTVLLKYVPPASLIPQAVARLRYEHRILTQLQAAQVPQVVQTLGWVEHQGVPALMLNDARCMALGKYHPGGRWDVGEALNVGMLTAQALQGVHRAGIVHKDINPSNIVYRRDTGVLQLIDFGIASQLPREVQVTDNVRMLEGTLAYMPPEQTGRLARSVDWRADLYALGATLYELLTGTPPFTHEDTARLVYAVMAEEPSPLRELAPHVPPLVARVVHKLLSKAPEERYQSASGVAHDLQLCHSYLQPDSPVDAVLACHDRPERFALVEKLYGRADAVQVLQTQYDRAGAGQRAVVWVHGPSGIGKSALVNELQPVIARDNGMFGLGKCDALHGAVPFYVVTQALRTLVKRMLMEPAEVLDGLRRRVQEAVGNVGQALVNLLSLVETLLGKQKDVPELGPVETENRLLMVFSQVFLSLARRQPLVLFCDDLQWADVGTFKLLKRLLTSAPHGERLLLVLAYRDHEVDAHHPLQDLLCALPQEGLSPVTLAVAPLSVQDIADMVLDATGSDAHAAQQLALLVHNKTLGNAFFVRDMLQRLWQQGLLRLDVNTGTWTWDTQAIAASSVSAGVADGMLTHWQSLDAAAQRALSAAACTGQDFALQDVCTALQQTPQEAQAGLAIALQEGLLLPLSAQYRYEAHGNATDMRYRFAHDKVQQAASQNADGTLQSQWRYRLAQAMLRQRSDKAALFALAKHLNAASAWVQQNHEELLAAGVNFEAGQHAMSMSAAATAREFFTAGLDLLPADAWQTQYELARDLHTAMSEAEYGTGEATAAMARLDGVVEHVRTPLEKAHALRRRAKMHNAHNNFPGALQDTFAALHLMHFPVVEKPTMMDMGREFVRLQWALRGKDIVRLGETPFSKDPHWAETLFITEAMGAAAQMTNPMILAVMCMQVVRGVLQHGLVTKSPHTFASMFPICAVMGNYKQGHQWVSAVHRCMERVPKSHVHGMVAFLELVYMGHTLLRPALYCDRCIEVSRILQEEGEAHASTWPLIPLRTYRSFTSLEVCLQVLDRYHDVNRAFAVADFVDLHAYVREFIAWAHERNEGFITDLATLQQRIHSWLPGNRLSFFTYHLAACWLDGRYADALQTAQAAFTPQVFENMDALLVPLAFYAVLTCTRAAMQEQRKSPKAPNIFKKCRKKLAALARGNDDIFGGIPALIDAELAALGGHHAQATPLYEIATRKLAGSGWTALAAAAAECAARQARTCAQHTLAAAYLWRALQHCRQWGNKRKAHGLEQEFAEYLAPTSLDAEFFGNARLSHRTTHTQSGQMHNEDIDLPALLAVSQALAEEMAIDKVAARIVEFTMHNAAATRAVLLLDFHDGRGFQVFADTAKAPWPIPNDLVGLSARTHEPVLINDVSKAPERLESQLGDAQTKAVLVVPLVQRGATAGVLVLQNQLITGAFTPERLTLVKVFAAQAAVAVVNARTHANLERAVGERTAQLQQAHGRILKYERDAAETQMAGGFAHEMRNALGAAGYTSAAIFGDNEGTMASITRAELHDLRGIVDSVQDATLQQQLRAVLEAMEQTQDMRNELGNTIVLSLRRGHAITEQILRYAEAGTLIAGDDAVSMHGLVDKVLRDLREHTREVAAQMQTDIPEQLVLPMKEEHAYIILRNLLKNACDALRSQPTEQAKRIMISGHITGQVVTLSVEDTGGGIPEPVQRKIFQPFFSTKGAAGTGLGLGLSRKLAQVYGGDLRFESAEAKGTRFDLILPGGSKPSS